jgi:hypothetical protein
MRVAQWLVHDCGRCSDAELDAHVQYAAVPINQLAQKLDVIIGAVEPIDKLVDLQQIVCHRAGLWTHEVSIVVCCRTEMVRREVH